MRHHEMNNTLNDEPGFYRQEHNFPLLPQVAGTVRLLEIVSIANGATPCSFIIVGGDDKQIQFYDLL